MTDQKTNEDKEVEKRRDAILKKMLETPPKPKKGGEKPPPQKPKGSKADEDSR